MAKSIFDTSGVGEQTSIDTSIETLKKYGLYTPPKKPKLGVLSKIGLLLNAFSPTTAAYKSMYEGKQFLPEYGKNIFGSLKSGITGEYDEALMKSQKSTKDILVKEGMRDIKGKIDATDILGFAGDVLTDPTTYVTAGLAKGGTKIFAEGGKAINLSKTGTKALEEFAQKVAPDMTREMVEKAFAKTITEAPEMLAKRGIRFAGQTIVPGGALDKIGLGAVADRGLVTGTLSSAVDLAEKAPIIGKKFVTPTVEAAKNLFDPLAAIKKALPDQAEYIDTVFKAARRGTEGEQGIAAKRLVELADEAYKLDPEAGRKITRAIEAGLGIAPEKIAEINAKTAAEVAGEVGQRVTKETLAKERSKLVKKLDNVIAKRDSSTNPVIVKAQDDTAKRLRAQITETEGKLEQAYKRGYYSPVEEGKALTRGTLDATATTGNADLDRIGLEVKDIQEQLYKVDVEKELVTGKIENYISRSRTKEANQMFAERGIDPNAKLKEYQMNINAGKSRVEQEQFVDNINAKFRKDFGVDFNLVEDDAFKATLKRNFDSIKAGNNVQLKNTLETELGVADDVLDKTGKYQGIQYVKTDTGKNIPKEVADALNKIKNISDDKSLNTFLQMYDKGLKFWKGSVTRYFPSFHARNFMGASFNNWLAGVDNPLRYAQAAKIVGSKEPGYIVTKNGTKISFDTIREQLAKSGILGQTGMFDVNKDLSDIAKTIGSRTVTQKAGKQIKKTSDAAFKYVEDEVRSTLYIDRLIRGDSPREAANSVFKFHFDYSPEAYTKFENSVLKRMAPFYTWTKNNIPLQLEQLGKQPGKYAAIMKVKNMFDYESGDRAAVEEEKALMPEYMKEQYTFKIPGTEGKTFQVPLPLEDITRMKPKEAYGLLAPFIKMPFELVANKNIYMDTEIANKTLPKGLQTAKTIISPKYMTPQMKKFFNIQETTVTDPTTGEEKKQYEMDATKMYIIRSLAGRLYSEAENWKKEDKAFAEKLTKSVTGLGAKTTDLQSQEYYQALDKNAQLSEVLKYFRAKGAMPSAEEEKASKATLKSLKPTKSKKPKKMKSVTAKLSTTASKQKKARALMASAKRNK